MTPSTDLLVQEHAPLVRRLALRLATKLPSNVELDDLIQAGMMGLLDAARRFQDDKGAQFTSYAITRINGAMMDELRQQDWLPRSARTRSRQIEDAMHTLEQENGRSATDSEIAEHLGVSTEDLNDFLDEARGIQLVHYEDMQMETSDGDITVTSLLDSIASDEPTPLDAMVNDEFKKSLVKAIAALPEKEKMVLSLSYERDLNFHEISEVMNLSRGRVSQIRTQAVIRLRAALKDMYWTAMPTNAALDLVN